MSQPFKATFTRPIPTDAEIIIHKDKHFARFKRASGKTVVAPLTKNGKRCRIKSEKYYGQVKGASGKWERVSLCTDKTMAGQMLADLQRKAERERHGDGDPFEDHRKRPLKEHREDFEAQLRAKTTSPRDVDLKLSRIRRGFTAAGCVHLKDLDPVRVQQAVADIKAEDDLANRTASWYV